MTSFSNRALRVLLQLVENQAIRVSHVYPQATFLIYYFMGSLAPSASQNTFDVVQFSIGLGLVCKTTVLPRAGDWKTENLCKNRRTLMT